MNYTPLKPINPDYLDFLSDTLAPEIREQLTRTAKWKVPCICTQCRLIREVGFDTVYRRRETTGPYVCRKCQAKTNAHPSVESIDPQLLDFLDDSIDPTIKSTLTRSKDWKVPCKCSRCLTVRDTTFFSVLRQRETNGVYICRACQAKENGKLASKGLAKREQTNLAKFGVTHPAKLKQYQRNNFLPYNALHGHPMHNVAGRQKIINTNMARYAVPYTTMLPSCHNQLSTTQTSVAESELRTYLESVTGVLWTATWDVIPPKQLDGYNETLHCAFEYNGIYWHSEACHTPKQSHYDKYKMCLDKGITLFTIFEDEWVERSKQIKGFLAARLGHFTQRLYARQTTCQPLDLKVAQSKIQDWHIQSLNRLPVYAWGLKDVGGKVIAVMTFHPHHRENHHEVLVLSRLAFAPGVQVVGGASKLFQHAIRELPKSIECIISWSDNRWSQGAVYKQMGFTCDGELPPDYAYVSGLKRISKQQCTRRALGAIDGQTEHERAKELGLSRIYDCGKVRWRYTRPK